jgi:hypothetical protein
MTNKTEMVSVPRQLLEDMLNPCADFATHDRLRALLDAPAEDVRAVVDEPVAYSFRWDFEHGNGWQRNALRYVERLEGHEHEDHRSTWRDITPLYLHPQRPVVMPEPEAFERLVIDHYGFGSSQLCLLSGKDLKIMFDACLDEFARLNK